MLERLKALHLAAEEAFLEADAGSDKANELDKLAQALEPCIAIAEKIADFSRVGQ